MFSDNPDHVIFYPLDLPLPVSYGQFLQAANERISIEFPGTRFVQNQAPAGNAAKKLEEYLVKLARACKIYDPAMIWADETIPQAVSVIMQKISAYPVNALNFIDREDAARLRISQFASRVKTIEAQEHAGAIAGNLMDDIGNLLDPETELDFADAMRSIMVNMNGSRFNGRNFTVSKVGPNQISIAMETGRERPQSRQRRPRIEFDEDDT
jgi:hypothetical protein